MFTFISPSELPLLKQLRLPFMDAIQLNDPFLINKRVHCPGANQPLSDSEFSQAMEKSYRALEPHIKTMVTFEYYLGQAKQNKGKIEQQLQRPKTPKQLGLASVEQYAKVACLRLFKHIYQQGVWQDVGENHHGIALKLDTDHAYFRSASYSDKPQLFSAIEYDDARPDMPFKSNPFPALLRRPEHLAYEQEWRLIRPLSVVEQNKEKMRYCKIPKGLITDIYAGLDCPNEALASLKMLVKQDLHFRGVGLKQIGVSETHLRLVATSVAE